VHTLAAFILGVFGGLGLPWFPFTSALCLVALGVLTFRHVRPGAVSALVALALGVAIGLTHGASGAGGGAGTLKPGEYIVEGHFDAPATLREDWARQGFSIPSGSAMDGENQLVAFPGHVEVYAGSEHPVGPRHALHVRASRPGMRMNPGAREQGEAHATLMEARLAGGEAHGVGIAFAQLRAELNSAIRARFGPETAPLIMAVTTGQKAEVPPAMREAFARAGVAHLLSISGTHFGVFAFGLFSIFRMGITRLPLKQLEALTARLTPGEAAALLTLPPMVLYLGLSGAGTPAVRSFVMVALFLVGLLAGRKTRWIEMTLAAGAGILLVSPGAGLTLSFQLSFIAVISIGLALRHPQRAGDEVQDMPEDERPSAVMVALRRVGALGATSLAASLGTMGIAVLAFHQASVIGPVANMVVTPLVTLGVIPLALVGAGGHLIAGSFVTAVPLEALARAAVALTEGYAATPGAWVRVPALPVLVVFVYYASFVPFAISGRVRALWPAGLCIAAIAVGVLMRPGPGVSVTFLDAGQADASVITLPAARTLVLDTGRTGAEVVAYLRHEGVTRVDALILSHAHADHTGGSAYIAEAVGVDEVWTSPQVNVAREGGLMGIAQRVMSRGMTVEGPGYAITALHPDEEFYTRARNRNWTLNNASLVLRLDAEGQCVMLPGDLQREGVEALELLALEEGGWLRCGVLKAPHHGHNPGPQAMLQALVRPALTVVTGPCMKNLPDALCTGRDGAVRVRLGQGGVRVDRYADYALRPARGWRGEAENLRRLGRAW
jgi:competence protein ComEC